VKRIAGTAGVPSRSSAKANVDVAALELIGSTERISFADGHARLSQDSRYRISGMLALHATWSQVHAVAPRKRGCRLATATSTAIDGWPTELSTRKRPQRMRRSNTHAAKIRADNEEAIDAIHK